MEKIELLSYVNQLEKTMKGLSNEDLTKPTAEDKWSKYQIFLHIVDSEFVFLERLKRILTEEEPELRGWQQAPWVSLEDSTIDIETNVEAVRIARTKLSHVLESLDDTDLERKGVHPRFGKETFEQTLKRMLNHANNHLLSIKA